MKRASFRSCPRFKCRTFLTQYPMLSRCNCIRNQRHDRLFNCLYFRNTLIFHAGDRNNTEELAVKFLWRARRHTKWDIRLV